MNSKKIKIALLCGMLGCVLMGTGDWLMLYGDPTVTGSSYWLTEGAAQIPAWRNALSMALVNPITFYLILKGISLLIPISPFRIAFTNGLMSEAMFLWFASMLPWSSFGEGDHIGGHSLSSL